MIRRAPYGVMFFLTGLFVAQIYLTLGGAPYPAAKMLAALSIACLGCLRSAMADREAAAPRLADRRLLAGTAVMVGVLYAMIAAALFTPIGESLKPWEFLIFPVCAFLFFLRSQASFLLLGSLEGLFIFYTIRAPGTAPVGHIVVLCAFWMGYLLLLAFLFLRDRQPDYEEVLAVDRELPLRAGPIAGLLLIDLFGLFLVVKPPEPIRPEPGRTDAPLEPLSIARWIEDSTLAFDRDLSFGDQPRGAGEDETVFVAQLRDETGRILDDFSFPPYWRLGALSIYRDGRWVAGEGAPEVREGPVRFPPPPPQVEAPAIEQRIILSPMRTDALFALSLVESIELSGAAVDAEDGVRRGSTPTAARPFKYVARSRPVVRVPPELAGAAARAPDPRYLHVPRPVANAGPFREATRRIGPAETAFAHAERAIEYLSWHEYTRTPGLRTEGDPTVEFLRHKRGYCQHFASAMALLLRQRGVPTRVAVGFAGGEWDPIARIVRVKRRHAHAWVEVHFDGLGWLPFDPATAAADRPAAARPRERPGETPDERPGSGAGAPGGGANRPAAGSPAPTEVRPVDEPAPADAATRRALARLFEELWARVEAEPAAARALGDRARGVEFVQSGEGRPRGNAEFFARVAAADAALLLSVAALAALLGAGLLRARRARIARRREELLRLAGADPPPPDAGPPAVPEEKDRASRRRRIARLYEDVLARAGAGGQPREAHVTASEFLEFNPEVDGLRELTALFERARYAPEAPTDRDVAAAREASRRAARSLKRDR
jgi:transglutaminase-like putative cysteine protease